MRDMAHSICLIKLYHWNRDEKKILMFLMPIFRTGKTVLHQGNENTVSLTNSRKPSESCKTRENAFDKTREQLVSGNS